jgi:hypothetical protein
MAPSSSAKCFLARASFAMYDGTTADEPDERFIAEAPVWLE